jgi:hypothetical protein
VGAEFYIKEENEMRKINILSIALFLFLSVNVSATKYKGDLEKAINLGHYTAVANILTYDEIEIIEEDGYSPFLYQVLNKMADSKSDEVYDKYCKIAELLIERGALNMTPNQVTEGKPNLMYFLYPRYFSAITGRYSEIPNQVKVYKFLTEKLIERGWSEDKGGSYFRLFMRDIWGYNYAEPIDKGLVEYFIDQNKPMPIQLKGKHITNAIVGDSLKAVKYLKKEEISFNKIEPIIRHCLGYSRPAILDYVLTLDEANLLTKNEYYGLIDFINTWKNDKSTDEKERENYDTMLSKLKKKYSEYGEKPEFNSPTYDKLKEK